MASRDLFNEVRRLPYNSRICSELAQHKCTATFVKWEDTARDKGSCWGKNISDVTLDVDDTSFPIIGTKNFADPTFDLPIERFSVNVGNEKAQPPTRITLKEYLTNLGQYIESTVTGSMFLDRDQVILTSSQATVLPLRDGKVEFNVKIHNYQYDKEDPAVLCVVVSPHGTSAQLLTEYNQKVYFNNGGEKASYEAERLMDVRIKAGKSTAGPMTQEEQEKNVLFVFQIPLKQKPKRSRGYFTDCSFGADDYYDECFDDSDEDMGMGSMESCCLSVKSAMPMARGFDHAQLSIGKNQGRWNGTPSSYKIERDDRFPIRCTIQYYWVTDSSELQTDTIMKISKQVWKLFDETDRDKKGSLVTTTTDRATEPKLSTPAPVVVNTEPFFTF